jgi:hypothetical protein
MTTYQAEYPEPCAVVGCHERGQAFACPYDGLRHGHGCIHYNCHHEPHFAPASKLTFLPEGWHRICPKHYWQIVAELRLAEQERFATLAKGRIAAGALCRGLRALVAAGCLMLAVGCGGTRFDGLTFSEGDSGAALEAESDAAPEASSDAAFVDSHAEAAPEAKACPTIQIVDSVYAQNCGTPASLVHLAPMCNGETTCTYVVNFNYDPGFDPSPGCPKDLTIHYRCGDEVKTIYEAAEATVVELTCVC